MPTVPRLTRQVDTAALPGVRLDAAETPLSEGAQVAEAQGQEANALSGVGAKTAALGEEYFSKAVAVERRRANEVANLSNDSAMLAKTNDIRSRALATRGKDAFGLPEQTSQEFNDFADQLEANATTPEQKLYVRRLRVEHGAGLDLAVRTHTYSQIQQYQGQELQSLVENSKNAAIANATDPRVIGTELQRQETAIRTHAKDLGFGPEAIQQQVDAARSATHVGVIENLLAQEQTKTAQVYFEESKDQINGEQIGRIEKALREGSVRKDAQKQSDAIIAGGGTLQEQRAKAREITDPEVRDAVMERVEHEAAISDRSQREQEEAALKTAYNIVDQTKDVSKIPPTAWVSFDGSARSALRTYADKLSRGESIETDMPTYYGLINKAGTDPNSFATENLLRYRAKIGDTEFKQLAELQLSIRNKEANAVDKVFPGFRDREQILNDTLTQYGIDPKDKDKAPAIAQLRRMLDERVDAAQADGKKVSNGEIQQTLDGLMGQSVTTPGSWWGLIPFNGISFSETKKRLIDMTTADIPDAERATMERALRDSHRTVTDQTVLDTYLNVLVRRNYKAGK